MDVIEEAISAYSNGRLVAIPTETVYGLSAPIDDLKLIERIFKLKERPFFDPLIVHSSSKERLIELVLDWSDVCDALAKAFWPGPMTLVLKKTETVSDMITAGLDTVGVRIPDSELTLKFLEKLDRAVAAPSANLFKKISPTEAKHVRQAFKEEDIYVLDGGSCKVGIESTILKVEKNIIKVLRPGMLTQNEIEKVVEPFGYLVEFSGHNEIIAPGQMDEHYRPEKPLCSVIARSFEEAKSFAPPNSYWIELPGSPQLAARELYGNLREASNKSKDTFYLYIPKAWLKDDAWKGILDRIKKASTSQKLVNK